MNFVKLNDNNIVNTEKVLYIKYVILDKSEVLWDRVDTTGGIKYVLIDGQHITEKYETEEAAKTAFDALSYEGFIKMENADMFINKEYVKKIKQDVANELKLDYMLFNGMVQDVFETAEEAEEGYNNAIEEFTGETPTPAPATLSSIAVTTPPTKTTYIEEEDFVSTGMVVTATYSDESTKVVSNYEVLDGINLQAGQTNVTIKHTEDGVSKTATQAINVSTATLESIEITTAPTKTTYVAGESFDPTGMVITGTYNNSKTKAITTYAYTPQRALTAEDTEITITVGELTVTQAITVSEINQEETVE